METLSNDNSTITLNVIGHEQEQYPHQPWTPPFWQTTFKDDIGAIDQERQARLGHEIIQDCKDCQDWGQQPLTSYRV